MKRNMLVLGMVMALAGAMLAGCATGAGKGLTPEEEISLQMEKWREAMMAKDVDAIMVLFSDKFEHYDWRDKAGAKMFILEAIDMGYMDDMDVILDDAQIKVDGNVASVYPVDLVGNFGSLSMELIVSRENGEWLLTGMDAPGL
ncbi:MAG TPA: nuclear transport factor 2 family protein [Candidatus Hydrogenedentes bacterium]|nr:nuclear transport factor 2 family protein [Candidatus Hydrogenedentota bacterium]